MPACVICYGCFNNSMSTTIRHKTYSRTIGPYLLRKYMGGQYAANERDRECVKVPINTQQRNRKLYNYLLDNIWSIRRPRYKSNGRQVKIISIACYGKKLCCVWQSSIRPSIARLFSGARSSRFKYVLSYPHIYIIIYNFTRWMFSLILIRSKPFTNADDQWQWYRHCRGDGFL